MARIAFIEVTASWSYGGLQTWVWHCAEVLARRGHEVTVFTGEGPPRPDLPFTVRTYPFRKRDRFPDLGKRFQRIGERLSLIWPARDDFLHGQFDWAIVTKPFDFFWPWFLPKTSTTRFAFASGGTDFFPGDRTLIARIDRLLSCSHFNAWQLSSHYKQFPLVVPNGVNCTHFAPATAAIDRATLGLPEGLLFGFAGRLVGWKGLRVAIEAMASPPMQALPEARLLIIGDGADKPALMQRSAALGLAGRVIFHDSLPHAVLPRYYQAIDVGVFPSVGDEAFGITIAEAMACGKPVIASHVGGIPEVVGNEESCGLLVPPGNALVLGTAMARLATDAELRHRMGLAARQRILQYFTWDRVGLLLEQALELPAP
ncbi:MAG: glycosyltransferase family 4 protein [Magnetococcales bacterium]|nr:glycosyltransferase family 4 protein [Magnetococcales bacterium]